MTDVPKSKPKCVCGSDEFFIGFDSFVCYICKTHYKKAQFWGTIIQTLSNADWEPSHKLERKK